MPLGFRIFPSPTRAPQQVIDALGRHAVSNLCDSMGRAHNAAGGALRPMHRGGRLCGPAITVRTAPGDNLLIHKAIDTARPGDVIVVDGGGALDAALIGDIMTSYAATRSVGGFVIDGAVRDTEELATRDLPVYARGVSPRGPTRGGPGEINVPVAIAGTVVQPGDIVVGDADGLVFVPPAQADELLKAVAALLAKEKALLDAIARGSADRRWVDETLAAKGCTL
ncbi:MAG TPA: RraA family protein [Burkholderiales bacterium]|nr:RraA family protein [Burkholderiales bacterium]